jgi:hypothetical protein
MTLLVKIQIKIQIIVCEYGAEAMAQELGKPYKTLMRELNPNDEGAKLGLMTFLQILRITQNYSPLNMIAKMFGQIMIDVPERVTENELASRLSVVLKEMGELLRELGKATAPTSEGGCQIVENERLVINDTGYDLLQALACLLTHMER